MRQTSKTHLGPCSLVWSLLMLLAKAFNAFHRAEQMWKLNGCRKYSAGSVWRSDARLHIQVLDSSAVSVYEKNGD